MTVPAVSAPIADAIAAYGAGTLAFDALTTVMGAHAPLDSRAMGAVYTPGWIVDRILDHLAPTPADRVLDPAVGRGAFLVPLLERTTRGMDATEALAWLNGHTACYDIDAAALADLRAVLVAWFWRAHRARVDPDAITALHHADALAADLGGRFSIAMGNPPYVRFQSLAPERRAWLKERFASCALGNIDLYHAFVERALEAADRVGFIVPHAFLTTRSGANLRRILQGRVDRVVDFGARRVFPGVGTYTCLLFAQAHSPTAVVVEDATGIERTFLAALPRPAAARAVVGELATLCNKAYAVERVGGAFVATTTGMPVEEALVRPLIKVTKFRGSTEGWTSFVLHPYHNGRILDPDAMAAHPGALAHLEAMRPELAARDRGDTRRYPHWYAYGRSQGLAGLVGRRALLVPSMMGGLSRPHLADLVPLQRWGPVMLASGFGVDDPSDDDIEAILSPRFQDLVESRGAAKPGANGALFHTVGSWMIKGAV